MAIITPDQISKDWRKEELTRKQVIEKYGDVVPPLLILKIDVNRRGIYYTDRAFAAVDPEKHHVEPSFTSSSLSFGAGERAKQSVIGLTLRDGTAICDGHSDLFDYTHREPYILDVVDGKLVLIDEGEVLEEVTFWDRPDFYSKTTRNGTPMWQIATARPQRITINPGQKCHFWDTPGDGCKFCSIFHENRGSKTCERDEKYFEDVEDTVREALKEKGRYASYHMTSGSTLSGKELFDDEVDLYIKTYQAAGRAIGAPKFPVKLVASAFSKEQLQRMYDTTGITTYTTDLECLNEELFNWICPGKAKFVGYQEWKKRAYDAVDIFGPGHVNIGFVAGVETAQPNGFKDENEALKVVLAEANEIASHGVSFAECVWNAGRFSYFAKQHTPSLEYYVRLAAGLADARKKNGLWIYTDDYRRCGNHPNTDLARIEWF